VAEALADKDISASIELVANALRRVEGITLADNREFDELVNLVALVAEDMQQTGAKPSPAQLIEAVDRLAAANGSAPAIRAQRYLDLYKRLIG